MSVTGETNSLELPSTMVLPPATAPPRGSSSMSDDDEHKSNLLSPSPSPAPSSAPSQRGRNSARNSTTKAERPMDMDSMTDDISSILDGTMLRLGASQSLIDALQHLDKDLVSSFEGDAQGVGVKHVVRDGEIGLGDHMGKALFFRPGSYRRVGLGNSFHHAVPVSAPVGSQSTSHTVRHMDVTYMELAMGNVGVVQKGDKQYIIGPGRYLLRLPTSLLGTVDLYNLKTTDQVTVYTEEPVEKRDVHGTIRLETIVKDKKLVSGYRESIGAVTFLRPAPGFRYVTRSANGSYSIGDTFKIIRSGEHFVKFLDYQKYSRTTKTFSFQSKDFQNVELRVQLSWRLNNGELWLESAGGYEDIFDALEEKAQALFRDCVGSLSHEEALDQRKEGFEKLERMVRKPLEDFAADLGGELVDVQIREMLFPLVLVRQQELARREQESKEKILTAEREMLLQKRTEQMTTEKQAADTQRKRELAEQSANIEKVEAQREMAKVIAQAEREKAQLLASQERKKAELIHQKEQAEVLADRTNIEATSAANVKRIQAAQEAEAQEARARAEANAILSKAKAQAQAEIELAKAKAESLRLLGDSFRQNPEVFQLELARLQAETERVRVTELAKALAANPAAFLPIELQRDLLRMNNGFAPEVPSALCSTDYLAPKAAAAASVLSKSAASSSKGAQ